MDWPTILGSVSGGVLGFVGAIVTKGLSIYEARQNHKMELERLELASRIDVQKADLTLRQTREDHAGAAFTASVSADAASIGESKWVKDFRSLWRPGLTVLLVAGATVQGFFQSGDTRDFLNVTLANLAAQAVGFWFGVRTFEKTAITPVVVKKP